MRLAGIVQVVVMRLAGIVQVVVMRLAGIVQVVVMRLPYKVVDNTHIFAQKSMCLSWLHIIHKKWEWSK
jgi:hypothetical protein